MKQISLIGPLPNNRPESIGGTTMMFSLLVKYFEASNFPHHTILSNKHTSSIQNLIHVIRKMITHRKDNLVMLNISSNSFLLKTLPIFILTRIFNQKLILRVFGGDMKEKISAMSPITKWLLYKTVFKYAELILPETKRLMSYYKDVINHIDFFPNIRTNNGPYTLGEVNYKKRFVFMSQVKEEKGIDLILETINRLDESYTIDIYGPILDSKYIYFENESFYKGKVDIYEVLNVIKDYDVILLPTHWPGEGYPGIILEGYSLGKPVITTNWLAIPEIVDHGKSGILIDSHSVEQLVNAMVSINQGNYESYSKSAFDKFEVFSSDNVHNRIYKRMQNL